LHSVPALFDDVVDEDAAAALTSPMMFITSETRPVPVLIDDGEIASAAWRSPRALTTPRHRARR